MIEFLKSDIMVETMFIAILILIILYIYNQFKLNKIQRNYQIFLNKLGKDTNIEQDIKKYIDKVEAVDKENKELIEYCNRIKNNVQKCIQKVGIVRYTAFKDIGSDLSFALALLDNENSGVVLNGIYSREMSNIYAKPVINGESSYTLSEEEKEAIKKAMNIEYK